MVDIFRPAFKVRRTAMNKKVILFELEKILDIFDDLDKSTEERLSLTEKAVSELHEKVLNEYNLDKIVLGDKNG